MHNPGDLQKFKNTSSGSQISFGNCIRYLLLLCMFDILVQCNADFNEEIAIPDRLFLEELIDQNVDHNNDGSISYEEAEALEALSIWPSGITDMTGIEAFINLDTIRVYMNPLVAIDLSKNRELKFIELIACELSKLDVSENHMLEYLDCSSGLAMKNYLTELDLSMNPLLKFLACKENQLSSLNVSDNPGLRELHCGYNLLTSLNLSYNTNLEVLSCTNNQLQHIDVSVNTELRKLSTCGNNLNSLDISKNKTLILLGIDNMPELYEVFVWQLPFPPDGLRVLSGSSPNIQYILK